eukprot:Em0016g642a
MVVGLALVGLALAGAALLLMVGLALAGAALLLVVGLALAGAALLLVVGLALAGAALLLVTSGASAALGDQEKHDNNMLLVVSKEVGPLIVVEVYRGWGITANETSQELLDSWPSTPIPPILKNEIKCIVTSARF